MSLHRTVAATLSAAVVLAFALASGLADDAAPPAAATYVGDKVCQKCHFQQHKSWKKSAMARSMKALQPTAEADDKALFDRKKAANLDPAKDYTTDEKCLKCHTTGYGEAGGYPKDPKADEAAEKAAAVMGTLSCETCHGPGSVYAKHKQEEVTKNKDVTFTWEELAKFGLVRPNEAVCARCHNKDAAVQPVEPFKFEDAKAKIHEHPAPKK